jgi:hypothetical protein
MQDLIIAYEELKQRAGKLDFIDLLLKVRNLVRDDAARKAAQGARIAADDRGSAKVEGRGARRGR